MVTKSPNGPVFLHLLSLFSPQQLEWSCWVIGLKSSSSSPLIQNEDQSPSSNPQGPAALHPHPLQTLTPATWPSFSLSPVLASAVLNSLRYTPTSGPLQSLLVSRQSPGSCMANSHRSEFLTQKSSSQWSFPSCFHQTFPTPTPGSSILRTLPFYFIFSPWLLLLFVTF